MGANLTSTGTGANLVYDSHGNITQLATETLGYDDTNRHLATTLTDGTKVTYQRDPEDRVISMTQTPASGTSTTVYYAYDGTGDAAAFTLDGNNTTQEQEMSLPGGVTVSIRATSEVWSYPGITGNSLVTADQTGGRVGAVALYDPFGDPIDPVTGQIGTLKADTAGPSNTTTPNVSNGFEGQHGKGSLTLDGLNTIEMGARQYIPLLGRFLSVDPVAAGNANDYNYPNDPINHEDLTGKFSWGDIWSGVKSFGQFLTDNPVASTILNVCSLVPGGIGVGCSVVQAAAYLVQGRLGEAAASAIGIVAGGVVGKLAVRAIAKSVGKIAVAARFTTRRAAVAFTRKANKVFGRVASSFGSTVGYHVSNWISSIPAVRRLRVAW